MEGNEGEKRREKHEEERGKYSNNMTSFYYGL